MRAARRAVEAIAREAAAKVSEVTGVAAPLAREQSTVAATSVTQGLWASKSVSRGTHISVQHLASTAHQPCPPPSTCSLCIPPLLTDLMV